MTVRGVRKTPESRDRDRSKVRIDEVVGAEITLPHGLTRGAAEVWQATVDALRNDGRLHGAMAPFLERWAITVDRARMVDAILGVEGLMVDDRPHPLLPSSIALAEKVRMMARELGLTPAARLPTLVPAPKPDLAPVSPIAALMARRGG